MMFSSHLSKFVFLSLIFANFLSVSFQLSFPIDQKTMNQTNFTEQQLNEWKDYKIKFDKVYDDQEDLKRISIYFDAKKTIDEHNKLYKEGKVSFEMGINQFSDKTQEEFKKHCCGLKLPNKVSAGSS